MGKSRSLDGDMGDGFFKGFIDVLTEKVLYISHELLG